MCVAPHDLVFCVHRHCLITAETTVSQHTVQHWLDLTTNRVVCVPNPRDIGLDIKWSTQRFATLVGDNNTCLTRYQFCAQIVRMTADAQHEPGAVQYLLSQRTKICDKTIVAHHQLVKLTARREILIFKAMSLTALDWPEHATNDRFVDRGEFFPCARKEPRHHREPMTD